MPSNPCEKFPGSNNTVVSSPESLLKLASRHECPKWVSSIPILWRRGWGCRGYLSRAIDAGGGGGAGDLRAGFRAERRLVGQRGPRSMSADLRRHPRFGMDRAHLDPAL